MELQFFVSNFDTAATCASMLAGFSFGGLSMSDFTGILSKWDVVIIAYYSGVAIAFGANFLCFILALLCRIQGVGLALKGPDGSMKTSVERMRVYQAWTLTLLEIGLFAFHFSALALAWVQLREWTVIILTSFFLLCSASGTAFLIRETKTQFKIPEGHEVIGSLSSSRIMRGLQGHVHHEPTQMTEMSPFQTRRASPKDHINGLCNRPEYQSLESCSKETYHPTEFSGCVAADSSPTPHPLNPLRLFVGEAGGSGGV